MSRLIIRHESLYSFPEPVQFGRWRLLMRPLDTHAIRIIEASLETPPGELAWTYDAYGNCVCYLQPAALSDQLRVVNNLTVERYPANLVGVGVIAYRSHTPVVYADADRRVLEPFIGPDFMDFDPQYDSWLRSVAPFNQELAIDFLRRVNAAIHDQFTYGVRDEPGTQSPAQTVASHSGTCRDFAWLMIETVRQFGFAARFATGYLFSPGATVQGAGATHAWCEVFLPGEGWTEFDPTNGLIESPCLIRVATTRTWAEADPMNGTVFGSICATLKVSVDVDLVDETGPAGQMVA